MQTLLPLFKTQSTIVFIDDDEKLLQTLNDYFTPKYNVITFSDPIKALQYLQNIDQINQNKINLLENKDILLNFHNEVLLTQINFESINKFIPIIKQQVPLIVVDQNMPEISGVEICRQITNETKKILLTGSDDLQLAIEAFNQQIIHAHIKKGDANTMDNLATKIDKNIHNYFGNLSSPLLKNLESLGFNYVTDGKFIEAFKRIINDLSIVEYHIVNQYAEFEGKDASGNVYNILFKTKQMLMDEFISPFSTIPELYDVVYKVANQDYIPYFKNVNINATPYAKWESHLYKSEKFTTDLNEYHFVCIPNKNKHI